METRIIIFICTIILFIFIKWYKKKTAYSDLELLEIKNKDDNKQRTYRLKSESEQIEYFLNTLNLKRFNYKINCDTPNFIAPFIKNGFGDGYWRNYQHAPFCVFIELKENDFKEYIDTSQPEFFYVRTLSSAWSSEEEKWGYVYHKLSDFIFISVKYTMIYDSRNNGLLDKLNYHNDQKIESGSPDNKIYLYKKN